MHAQSGQEARAHRIRTAVRLGRTQPGGGAAFGRRRPNTFTDYWTPDRRIGARRSSGHDRSRLAVLIKGSRGMRMERVVAALVERRKLAQSGGTWLMLVLLAEWLTEQFYSGFQRLSVFDLRGILGVLTALLISLIVGPAMIRRLEPLSDRPAHPRRWP
jgi:hypothetical protein